MKEKEKLIKEISKIKNGHKLQRNSKPCLYNKIFDTKITFSIQKEKSSKEIGSVYSLNNNVIANTENYQNKLFSECSISSIKSLDLEHQGSKSKEASNADTFVDFQNFTQFINNHANLYTN